MQSVIIGFVSQHGTTAVNRLFPTTTRRRARGSGKRSANVSVTIELSADGHDPPQPARHMDPIGPDWTRDAGRGKMPALREQGHR
jgi:hypothetical protein